MLAVVGLERGVAWLLLLLTDWGPGASRLLRTSSREHELTALRELAQRLPTTRFVLVGDTGQQDPQISAEFAAEHAEQSSALLAALGVPFLVTGDSCEMLAHAREHGLVGVPLR